MKKILTIVCLFVSLLLFTAGCTAANSAPDNWHRTKTAQPASEVTPAPAQRIHFDNIIVSLNSGMTNVNGEVKNNDTKVHSFTLKVSFYDADQKLLGTANGAVNDLNGGETKLFTAIASEDYTAAKSYKVQVDTNTSTKEN